MAKTLDDIFDDDDFGLLSPKEKALAPKTDDDRLIDSFEEINTFFEKNNREPASSSMSEYNLLARLKGFRNDELKKKSLKPFDRFNLLGHVEMEKKTLDEILDEDDFGLLNTDGDTSIFQFRHTPQPDKRAEADFIAKRKAIPEKEFQKYEAMFRQVHKELKDGKRRLAAFRNIEKNLHIGDYYLLDGLLLFLESADIKDEIRKLSSGDRSRIDGRTVTIFENATKSNLNFRSLGKALQKSGNIITNTDAFIEEDLNKKANTVSEEDIESGWVYVLKSKSENLAISSLKDLYKIGFSTTSVADRVKNASQKSTYLFADVEIVATYHCYSLNTRNLENLLHRFFGECCLDIDLYDSNKQRLTPREWFVVPLQVINEAIELLQTGEIFNYFYDKDEQEIILKSTSPN